MSHPVNDDSLFDHLTGWDIPTQTIAHPPVFTVEDAKALRGPIRGGHTKNLFVADKKGQHWLIVALEETRIDLKQAARQLGAASRLSFGKPADMAAWLGVSPGSVTPFGLINDRDRRVIAVLDQAMLAVDPLNFHPLRNDRTTTIATTDLLRFLTLIDHPPRILDQTTGV